MVRLFLIPVFLVLLMTDRSTTANAEDHTAFQKKPFGKTSDGVEVDQFILTNKNGMVAKIITYGGIITELLVPDRDGKLGDVCLGFDSLDAYLKGHPHFGCITGRVANRIAKGKFTLNGKDYSLAINNGPNSLHGGLVGFDKKVWQYLARVEGPDYQGIKLHYQSKDGEENYPGTLDTTVTYILTDANELKIEYTATTDQPTPVNLTNHAYFNLSGGKSDVLGHVLKLNSYRYTPTDDTGIPTGKISDVVNTPLDFYTKEHTLGARIKELQTTPTKGYDHNFLVMSIEDKLKLGKEALEKRAVELGNDNPLIVQARKELAAQEALLKDHPSLAKQKLRSCARLSDPESGRVMEMTTTEPAVQLYTGNFLDGKLTGKGGVVYNQHSGVCLEAQHYPNSVNTPSFPNTILKPGETYRQTTVYTFSVAK